MLLPQASRLAKRDTGGSSFIIWVALAALAIGLILIVVCINSLRKSRLRSEQPPKYLPKFLHSRWRRWKPAYTSIPTPLQSQRHSTHLSARTPSLREPDDLDRRTSVRSIMTLPPYRITPLPTERLIAREGERGGVDTVVEYPESDHQAEERREEEMQALYNIRQARRREQTDREERRRLRREAREAGDTSRVAELERESRARARERRDNEQSMLQQLQGAEERGELEGLPAPDSAYLIAELNSLRDRNSRSRRVSSVSYADLGLARHDGSRIRAGSFESDNHPLLDSAASIGQRSRATSRASSAGRRPSINDLVEPTRPMTGHTRSGSYGGASYLSDDEDNAIRSPRIALLTPQSSDDAPPHPPSYEDDASVHGGEAPPYESPVTERNPVFSREESDLRRENSNATRRADEELRDEINIADRYLERGEDSSSSSPAADTPTESSGAHSTGAVEAVHSPQHAPSQTSPPATSPPIRSHPPNIQTKPRIPPQIEVSSATPVSSAPNSPIDGRTGSGG